MSYTKFLDSSMGAKEYWEEHANDYDNMLENNYHTERIQARIQLTKDLDFQGKHILDFGCGGGDITALYTKKEAIVTGVDISQKMINLAKKKFDKEGLSGNFLAGGVEILEDFPDAHFDLIVSFEVLAYLEPEEEARFYEQASRILKTNGNLALTYSNELFDLYTLNAYTCLFFNKHFGNGNDSSDIGNLLRFPDKPRKNIFPTRANPLNHAVKMSKWGFLERKQLFNHFHSKPPLLEEDNCFQTVPEVPDEDRWKLIFQCSIYGSLMVKFDEDDLPPTSTRT